MLGTRWPRKPPFGYEIDFEHPLAQGLAAFWPLNENSGGIATDVVGGVQLAIEGGAKWSAATSSGLLFNVNGAIASATAPGSLLLPGPLTFAVGIHPVNPSNSPTLAGIEVSGTGSLTFGYNSWPTPSFGCRTTGNSYVNEYASGFPLSAGADVVLASAMTPTQFLCYSNGQQVASHAISGTQTYPGTATISIGTSYSSYADTIFYWMALWSRALSATEIAGLANPWQIFEPRRSLACFASIAAITPFYTVSGPSGGIEGVPSAPFTVTPNIVKGSGDTITITETGLSGGTLSTTTLSWTTTAYPQTFTYTPPGTPGTATFALTSTDEYAIPGSPISYVARPVPTIASTVPAQGAAGVSVAASIVATFSEPIEPSSLAFAVAATSTGGPVAGVAALDATQTIATFTPARGSIANSTGYTASVDASGIDGNPMGTPYSWSWTTAYTAPTVTGYVPELAFAFGYAIVSAGLTVAVANATSGASVPGTTSYNSGTYVATFTPDSPFVVGSKYLVTVSGATAPDGTPMATTTFVFIPGTAGPGKTWFSGLGRPTMTL